MAKLAFNIAPTAEWGVLSCPRCTYRRVALRNEVEDLSSGHLDECPNPRSSTKGTKTWIPAGVWSVTQVSGFMGVSKTTIWRWTNSGKIPAGTIVKFRSCRYYRADKIQALGVIRPGSRRPHTGGYTKGSKRPVPDGVWSVKQVAAFMAVGPVSILRWANWGVIPSSAIVEYHGCKYYRESGIRELGVILSPGKVAKRYGVGRNTINRWRTTGLLRGIETPGNVFLYLEKELSAETRKD